MSERDDERQNATRKAASRNESAGLDVIVQLPL